MAKKLTVAEVRSELIVALRDNTTEMISTGISESIDNFSEREDYAFCRGVECGLMRALYLLGVDYTTALRGVAGLYRG